MLRDMDNDEASSIVYVKVGTFNHLEPSTICLLTVNMMLIVMLTVQHHKIFSICFM